jgi:hypothetical protein
MVRRGRICGLRSDESDFMLSLDSARWSELDHAYGEASDIPALLEALQTVPNSKGKTEPWFSIWSALAHQGDVYSASFAAVPHVVFVLASAPLKADFAYFQFPAWVEICRLKNEIEVPDDLKTAYFDALSQLPNLVAATSTREWNSDFMASALAAIAVAKGQPKIAEAVLEITPSVAEEFMQWLLER